MTTRPLSTALKCLDLLDAMAGLSGPARLADIARLTGETRATAYQRVLTLITAGWLERLSDGTFRLTLKACRIANAALGQAGLGERALPILQRLTQESGETSSLVVLQGDRPIIIQRVEAGGVLRADLHVGAEVSFKESASGRIWAAFGPADLVKRLAAAGIAMAAPEELASVRRDRLAIAGGGETLKGILGAAVPILSDSGACIASLSLFGPETRFDTERLVPLLRAAGERLAETLAGWSMS